MHLVFIQPDDTVDRHRLQMTNQRLNARQAAGASGDQQNIAAVMGYRLAHRVKRRGQRKLPGQHRILHFAEIHVQRHREQVKSV